MGPKQEAKSALFYDFSIEDHVPSDHILRAIDGVIDLSGVRKIISTTNAIESLNRVIRKTTKTRGSFPTDDAATKLIYLAIRSFEKNGRAVREWVAARNQFAILYPERFNK